MWAESQDACDLANTKETLTHQKDHARTYVTALEPLLDIGKTCLCTSLQIPSTLERTTHEGTMVAGSHGFAVLLCM